MNEELTEVSQLKIINDKFRKDGGSGLQDRDIYWLFCYIATQERRLNESRSAERLVQGQLNECRRKNKELARKAVNGF